MQTNDGYPNSPTFAGGSQRFQAAEWMASKTKQGAGQSPTEAANNCNGSTDFASDYN